MPPSITDTAAGQPLAEFFNHHHYKLMCTANARGEPSIALMGTPRLQADGTLAFELSDPVSTTLDNIRENKAVVFMAYVPGERARDFRGARLYAEVTEILSDGPRLDAIRQDIRERFGEDKAAELQATVTCAITRVRPIVDRGQRWDAPPFADAGG